MRGDVADVALGVPDHARDAFQHAEAVVAEDGQFHRIDGWSGLVAGPLHVDAALGFVKKIGHIGAVDGMYGHAFAARDVADDTFTADGITTACPVNHHVTLAADGNSIVIPKHASHNAGDGAGLRS